MVRLEVKMTDVGHQEIITLLLKLLYLKDVRVLNDSEHTSVLEVQKSQGFDWS